MRRIKEHISESLSEKYSALEVKEISKALCIELLGTGINDYYLDRETSLDSAQQQLLDFALSRLGSGEPLQYVLGYTFFCGLKLKTDARALIPRPETTELVEWILQDHATESGCDFSVLDIGVGSGAISLALKQNRPLWKVCGVDVEPAALGLASENVIGTGLDVELMLSDILEWRDSALSARKFNLIVSNPPYIAESEALQMEPTVLDYEPGSALFVPDSDPLLFYRKILEYALHSLVPGGKVYFEINPLFVEELETLVLELGFRNVDVRNDISGKQRMVRAML
ncbi:MAG: peptide chain release factor N(5)-glutamine methyltransferase [Bacteroidaceae bacterium]|nr:peptide chain release factor N(5)-glutamine methyltransferase [Bacteroidaceae bacterium]